VSATTWAPQTPEQKYGWRPPSPAGGQQSVDLGAVPSPSHGAAVAGKPWHPDNPLFWIGVLGATTFGLMAFSTNVRVGNARAGLAVGDSK
jgi:hypothetical protein